MKTKIEIKLNILFKAILAGILISTGCIVYLSCENKIVGSMLFSFGLFTICEFNLWLFTGKIGYVIEAKNPFEVLLTWVGNFIGTLLAAFLVLNTRLTINSTALIETKLNDSLLSLFILGIFCGMCMFIGVNIFKKSNNPVSKIFAIVFAVSVFILSGFEHCIADMFYMALAKNIDIVRLLIITLGNTVGGIATYFLENLSGKIYSLKN